MGKLSLKVKATLEGLTDLQPAAGHTYMFKISCTSCREVHPNWVGIDPNETSPMSGSRGEANLVWKCAFCKRESSVTFDSASPHAKAVYTADLSDSQDYAVIATFDCRGCELVEYDPRGGNWTAKGAESGSKFEEIELSLAEEDGWMDYDEKAAQPVSVTEWSSRLDRA